MLEQTQIGVHYPAAPCLEQCKKDATPNVVAGVLHPKPPQAALVAAFLLHAVAVLPGEEAEYAGAAVALGALSMALQNTGIQDCSSM